jgi:hypothetical protein
VVGWSWVELDEFELPVFEELSSLHHDELDESEDVPEFPLVADVAVVDAAADVALCAEARPANSPVPASAAARVQRVVSRIRRFPASRPGRGLGVGVGLVMRPSLGIGYVRDLAAR